MALRGFTYFYSKEQYSTSGQTCQWWDNDMALRGFTYFYSKEQYSTSGQTCQWWDNDMALRGFTYFLLQRTVQYIGSNVSMVG